VETDVEYITRTEPDAAASGAQIVDADGGSSSGSAAEDKAAFESTMDRTFQRFADRLAENPEQVLRYEWAGQPLLYAKTDAIGKLLAPAADAGKSKVQVQAASALSRFGIKVPRCANCGARREYELQLTPHAIMELEAEDMSLDGMDWGTIIVGSCGDDCAEVGKKKGDISYIEEWVGVQWEELATR
jgi:pre-rRNA-processing protein TSR4